MNKDLITLGALNAVPCIRHGFFTRRGGVSKGLYDSLNVGLGSHDDPVSVRENRRRCMARLELPAEALSTLYQIHSATAVTITEAIVPGQAPQADALVTQVPGIALGILTADCAPVLFCDPEAGVIGAAHAGWRGAFEGVLNATVTAMTALGARPERLIAGIGPHIAYRSYEVGPEFRDRLLTASDDYQRFFVAAPRSGHFLFDLGGFIEGQLADLGVGLVQRAPHDTLSESDRFFSYRRATLNGQPDYGRGLSAIALAE
jgi:polyphenol oxidase